MFLCTVINKILQYKYNFFFNPLMQLMLISVYVFSQKLSQIAHLKQLDQYYCNLINKTLTQGVDLKPNSWDYPDMYH